MRIHEYFVYITANTTTSTLYVGVTNSLINRITQHYNNRGLSETFAGRFHCYNLLHYEIFQYVKDAIRREKQIKAFSRKKKFDLIKKKNPELRFLNSDVFNQWPPKE